MRIEHCASHYASLPSVPCHLGLVGWRHMKGKLFRRILYTFLPLSPGLALISGQERPFNMCVFWSHNYMEGANHCFTNCTKWNLGHPKGLLLRLYTFLSTQNSLYWSWNVHVRRDTFIVRSFHCVSPNCRRQHSQRMNSRCILKQHNRIPRIKSSSAKESTRRPMLWCSHILLFRCMFARCSST